MARRVDQVQLVALPRDPHRLGLDRDPPLTLEIHRIEHLRPHVALRDGVCQLEDAVRERRLAVVDVRDDREIADVLLVHAGGDGSRGVMRGARPLPRHTACQETRSYSVDRACGRRPAEVQSAVSAVRRSERGEHRLPRCSNVKLGESSIACIRLGLTGQRRNRGDGLQGVRRPRGRGPQRATRPVLPGSVVAVAPALAAPQPARIHVRASGTPVASSQCYARARDYRNETRERKHRLMRCFCPEGVKPAALCPPIERVAGTTC